MVTDAQTNHLVFDVLTPTVEAGQIVARKQALLDALGRVAGFRSARTPRCTQTASWA